MQLRTARLCLDCEEIYDAQHCPVCTSESFAFVSRWVPARERRTRPRAASSPEAAAYRRLLVADAVRPKAVWLSKRGAAGLAHDNRVLAKPEDRGRGSPIFGPTPRRGPVTSRVTRADSPREAARPVVAAITQSEVQTDEVSPTAVLSWRPQIRRDSADCLACVTGVSLAERQGEPSGQARGGRNNARNSEPISPL